MGGRTNNRTKKIVYAGSILFASLIFFAIPFKTEAGFVDYIAKVSINIVAMPIAWIAKTIFWLTGLFLAMTAGVLELSVQYGIEKFAEFVTSSGSIVNIGWETFRDIANMLFLFIILWIGISIILSVNKGNPTSNIVKIVLVAILINFSMFFTKFIIDIANAVALHFYNLTVPIVDGSERSSLAGLFMSGLDVQTLYGSMTIEEGVEEMVYVKIVLFSVVGIGITLITSWVFLTAAFLMLIRTLYLIVLIILSPIAFVSWITPQLKNYTSRWWNALFKHAFFAPVFMAMLYVIGKTLDSGFISGIKGSTSTGEVLDSAMKNPAALSANPSFFSTFFYFFLIIGLLIAALITATKLGDMGGKSMVKWGKKAGLGILSKTGKTVGGTFANTVGASAKWTETKFGEKWRKGGIASRLALRGTQTLQNKKFFGGKSFKEREERGTMFKIGTKERLEDLRKIQNDPTKMIEYFASLNPKEQQALYTNELSPRARASLEQEAKKTGKKELIDTFNEHKQKLSVEEREKVDETFKKAEEKEKTKQALSDIKEGALLFGNPDINKIFNTTAGTTAGGYGPAFSSAGGPPLNRKVGDILKDKEKKDILESISDPKQKEEIKKLFEKNSSDFVKEMKEKMKRINTEQIRKLADDVNKNPGLIKMLSNRQLMALNNTAGSSELSEEAIKAIKAIINDTRNSYPNQNSHKKLLTDSNTKIAWSTT